LPSAAAQLPRRRSRKLLGSPANFRLATWCESASAKRNLPKWQTIRLVLPRSGASSNYALGPALRKAHLRKRRLYKRSEQSVHFFRLQSGASLDPPVQNEDERRRHVLSEKFRWNLAGLSPPGAKVPFQLIRDLLG